MRISHGGFATLIFKEVIRCSGYNKNKCPSVKDWCMILRNM